MLVEAIKRKVPIYEIPIGHLQYKKNSIIQYDEITNMNKNYFALGGYKMKEDFQLDIVTGKEKHFSPKKFIHKIKDSGFKLGFKALHGAATLFSALKSSDMPKKNKLLIAGVLGYFILPTDLIADFLPAVGLADDAFLIMQA
ncbi:hypothetical protein RhiirA1_484557, partial [Rhizophagus irregularis]